MKLNHVPTNVFKKESIKIGILTSAAVLDAAYTLFLDLVVLAQGANYGPQIMRSIKLPICI